MTIKLKIEANAIDSFNEAMLKIDLALQGRDKNYKYAVLHLSHSIELFLKMYLQTLDENLVFSKCFKKVEERAKQNKINLLDAFYQLQGENFDFEAIVANENTPHTVTSSQVLAIVKHEKCSKSGINFIDQSFIDDINWMKNLRNAIEHFEFELTPKELRLYVGRLVRGIDEFLDIFSLISLEQKISKESYDIYRVLADEYEQMIAEAHFDVRIAKKKIFQGLRPKEYTFVQWNEYYCEECQNNTIIPNQESSTGYKCTCCGNEESGEIECDCDVCGQPWPNREMSYWDENISNICPNCNNMDNKH